MLKNEYTVETYLVYTFQTHQLIPDKMIEFVIFRIILDFLNIQQQPSYYRSELPSSTENGYGYIIAYHLVETKDCRCNKKSNIRFWMEENGWKDLPKENIPCSNLKCCNTADVGAHVTIGDEKTYIVPTCQKCNNIKRIYKEQDASFYVKMGTLQELPGCVCGTNPENWDKHYNRAKQFNMYSSQIHQIEN